jgi:hypothetical protein
MKSGSLQKLVRKIYGDEKTRAEFLSDPESILSRFKLTEGDKKAVLQSYYKLGLVSSDSDQLEAAIKPTSWWASPVP